MKLRAWISIASLLFFCSCVANTVLGDAHNAENNISRLSRVSLRMAKETVLKIMHAPYDKEVFRIGEDRYEVWFYVTSSTVLGQSRMVPRNMTPLTFRDQTLVGFGYDYYYWLKRGGEIRISLVDENEAKENKELERELEKSILPTSINAQPTPTPLPTPGPVSPSKETTPPPNQTPTPSKPTTPRTPTNGPSPTNPKVSPSPPPKGPAQNPTQESGPRTNPPKSNPPPKQPPPKSNPVSMSKPPEKPPEKSKPEKSDQPEWDKKDEEINEDAMDQDFDFW